VWSLRSDFRFARGALVIGAFSLLTACAMQQPYPSAPARGGTLSAGGEYLVGPGDALNIVVWRNPEVSTTVPVRPDGKFTTPLVEDIEAIGKTPTQLARDIEKALSKYIQDPIVSVIVTGFNGPFDQQIRVVGQAAKPQALPYRQNMTLLDVMIAVGGVTDFADGNAATLVRNVSGKTQQFSVRLEDLVKAGDVTANIEMRPGDVLIIPESLF
jgi:polysaccharide biosynthesis/export protein